MTVGTRTVTPAANDLYHAHLRSVHEQTDRVFGVVMLVQWIGAIAAAYWIAPRMWTGAMDRVGLQLWTAVALSSVISVPAMTLSAVRPGSTSTRYVIATAQML